MTAIDVHLMQVKQGLEILPIESIQHATDILRLVRDRRGTIFLCGNGGSAATCSHFSNDLMKTAHARAVCLSDAFPVVSAYGNDTGWENMYVNQLREVYDAQRDCIVGISCSGDSENVVRALDLAVKRIGLSVGLTGNARESKLLKLDLACMIRAMVPDMRVQEDLHAIVCHAIVRQMLEEE